MERFLRLAPNSVPSLIYDLWIGFVTNTYE